MAQDSNRTLCKAYDVYQLISYPADPYYVAIYLLSHLSGTQIRRSFSLCYVRDQMGPPFGKANRKVFRSSRPPSYPKDLHNSPLGRQNPGAYSHKSLGISYTTTTTQEEFILQMRTLCQKGKIVFTHTLRAGSTYKAAFIKHRTD